ncbi:MBL fold metallo-hydrolase [Massilia sp. PAMC28688]|uniref:MBL fold metallo-hydrolase n=1 Tax=Massilia sp. PAMC28688 TaxID=2861283 RepID=UPI001C629C1D|nr:MBL fold metallo-hydrolase [Massilia sp. PAMC28688]QYF95351.1 MBL fold metallo-hydrolase [Massilia sp. PAMC28688]
MITSKLKQTALAAMLALAATAAHAAAPMAKTQAPGFQRMMLGAFEVTTLSDGTVDLPVDQLLSLKPQQTVKLLDKAHLAVPLETSVNAYLINTGSKLVLVDTGAGALFGPTVGRLLASLKAAGYEAGQVDEVLITHFHGDHVGGLLDGAKAAFPNATIRADKRESDFWLSQANMDKAPPEMNNFFKGAMMATKPYVDNGQFKPFDGDTEIVPGIRATSAYGHTPGHTTYLVESAGKQLLLVGDLIHVGAIQFNEPGVTIKFDSDPKTAAAARATAFQRAAKAGMLIGATHLSFPGIGYLYSDGKSYRYAPVNYTRARD